MTYTGDVLIKETDGDFDATWRNGQPDMTDGFETAVLFSVFGDRDTWQNGITTQPKERYVSTFPKVVTNAGVTEATKNDGVEALKTALDWMVAIRAARSVEVEGRILSVYAIGWVIRITATDGRVSRYAINWERGVQGQMVPGQVGGVADRESRLVFKSLQTADGEDMQTAEGETFMVEDVVDWRRGNR